MIPKSSMLYTMTNAFDHNEILAFERNQDGTLTFRKKYKTGGRGSGANKVDPLSSQGSIATSADGSMLFVVNAGSNTISNFVICENGALKLKSVIPSYGVMPTCLAVYENLLYVANAGDAKLGIASNTCGFFIDRNQILQHIATANYPLSEADAIPSCMVYDPHAYSLFISELNTNRISEYPIKDDGTLGDPSVNNSNGEGPFGAAFMNDDILLVCEAGANAVTSYKNRRNNNFAVISGSIPNNQAGTCWLVISMDKKFAYTSNAGSNTISIFHITSDGSVSFIKNMVNNPNANAAPIDNIISADNKYLYVLNGNEQSISVFQIMNNGDLQLVEIYNDRHIREIGSQGLAVI